MKFLNPIKLFTMFSREKYLTKIVEEEINKTKSTFSFDIKVDDQKLELQVIPNILIEYWDMLKSNSQNYDVLLRKANQSIRNKFEAQLRYYFESTPQGQTRTWYQCHLEAIVSRAFIHMSNDRS